MTIHTPEMLARLFELVKQIVWASGGDGEGWIVSRDWHQLAEQFKDREDWFTEFSASPDEHVLSYYHDQEGVCFTAARDLVPPNVDIIVEIRS